MSKGNQRQSPNKLKKISTKKVACFELFLKPLIRADVTPIKGIKPKIEKVTSLKMLYFMIFKQAGETYMSGLRVTILVKASWEII